MNGTEERIFPLWTGSQSPLAQNYPYAKEAYLGLHMLNMKISYSVARSIVLHKCFISFISVCINQLIYEGEDLLWLLYIFYNISNTLF